MHMPDVETVEQASEIIGHLDYEFRREEQAGAETLDVNRHAVLLTQIRQVNSAPPGYVPHFIIFDAPNWR